MKAYQLLGFAAGFLTALAVSYVKIVLPSESAQTYRGMTEITEWQKQFEPSKIYQTCGNQSHFKCFHSALLKFDQERSLANSSAGLFDVTLITTAAEIFFEREQNAADEKTALKTKIESNLTSLQLLLWASQKTETFVPETSGQSHRKNQMMNQFAQRFNKIQSELKGQIDLLSDYEKTKMALMTELETTTQALKPFQRDLASN